jgi:hypothetical protein
VSDYQADVLRVLQAMGGAGTLEQLTPDGMFSVDIAVTRLPPAAALEGYATAAAAAAAAAAGGEEGEAAASAAASSDGEEEGGEEQPGVPLWMGQPERSARRRARVVVGVRRGQLLPRGTGAAAGAESRPLLVAIEYDGSYHYTRSKPYRVLGDSLLRAWLLTACGFAVVNVAWFEWAALEENEEAKATYLGAALVRALRAMVKRNAKPPREAKLAVLELNHRAGLAAAAAAPAAAAAAEAAEAADAAGGAEGGGDAADEAPPAKQRAKRAPKAAAAAGAAETEEEQDAAAAKPKAPRKRAPKAAAAAAHPGEAVRLAEVAAAKKDEAKRKRVAGKAAALEAKGAVPKGAAADGAESDDS